MLSFLNNLNINLREKLSNTTSKLIATYINNYSTHLEYTNELDKYIEFTADQTLNNPTYFTLPNLEPKIQMVASAFGTGFIDAFTSA
jgi:hypothetical protein